MADFEWYRSFVAIYRQGSVSAAAASRHMTQPALSQHLAALESEMGSPLFYRQPRKMVPTEHGIALYNQVAHAIDRLERATSESRTDSLGALIRLGAPVEYFKDRVAPIVAGDKGRIAVTVGQTAALLDALTDHRLDVVVATQHVSSSGLQFVRLDTEHFLLVGSTGLSLVASPNDANAVRAELEQMPWISYAEDLPIIRRFWMESFRERPAFTARMVVPDLHAMGTLVQHGGGVSVLPAYLIQREIQTGLLTVLWSPPRPVQNEIWLAYRTADRNDGAINRFVHGLLTKIRNDAD